MYRNILTNTTHLLLITLTLGTRVASAQNFVNPLGSGSSIESLLNTIIDVVIFILIPVIVLMLVYTGFLFVQAQGNPAKLSEARKVFVWTLVGAFVILAARALKDAVVATVSSL
jgi:heme/copper-type cytochrome/quinol oxidase subunit 2